MERERNDDDKWRYKRGLSYVRGTADSYLIAARVGYASERERNHSLALLPSANIHG
jgi:hypothetical protein